MTIAELIAEVERREVEGRDRMVMCVMREREPSGRKVRVLPGVLGVMVGFDAGKVIADVAVADLRRFLDRAGAKR